MRQHRVGEATTGEDRQGNGGIIKPIIVGIVVAAVVGAATPWWWPMLDEMLHPDPTGTAIIGSVSFNPAGLQQRPTSSILTVSAKSPAGRAIRNARVTVNVQCSDFVRYAEPHHSVSPGSGKLQPPGQNLDAGLRLNGKTDKNGTFTARWTPPSVDTRADVWWRGHATCEFVVTVEKQGYDSWTNMQAPAKLEFKNKP